MIKFENTMFMLLLVCLALQTSGLRDQDIVQDGDIVQLSLQNYTHSKEYNDSKILLSKNANITVRVEDIPNTIKFVVLQVHTYLYSVLLKYSPNLTDDNNINGTNIGLVKFTNASSNVEFYVNNLNSVNVSSLIVVVGYTGESPVPGGCAMEAPTPIAPYINLNYTDIIITVTSGPSSLPNSSLCDPKSGLVYEFYHTFLPEWDFTEATYFSCILKMITYNSVVKNSLVAKESITGPQFQRVFSNYPGIGRIFTVTVTSPSGGVSVYVPTFTYSCNITSGTENCELPRTKFANIEFTILGTIGLFIYLKGHVYFLINLFIMSSITGSFISYIILVKTTEVDMDVVMVSSAIGLVIGVIWISIWWCLRSPILSMSILPFNCGCLLAAFLFTFARDLFPLLESDINYWAIFFSIALILLFISIIQPLESNLVATTIIGTYMLIVPIALAAGSSIVYVIVNVIRRAIVEGFNLANTEVPMQVPDTILVIVFLILFVIGRWRQKVQSRGRPPFPPPPIILRSDERTPLLNEEHT